MIIPHRITAESGRYRDQSHCKRPIPWIRQSTATSCDEEQGRTAIFRTLRYAMQTAINWSRRSLHPCWRVLRQNRQKRVPHHRLSQEDLFLGRQLQGDLDAWMLAYNNPQNTHGPVLLRQKAYANFHRKHQYRQRTLYQNRSESNNPDPADTRRNANSKQNALLQNRNLPPLKKLPDRVVIITVDETFLQVCHALKFK